MTMPESPQFFATAAKGTEGALRDELRELRIPGVRAARGGVHFGKTWEDAWLACLHSRIALRVLAEVARFEAPCGESLYAGVREVEWATWLTPRHTLAVTANCRSGALTHTGFIAQKTKDAIVDRLRDHFGVRPFVDRKDPDLHVVVHIVRDQAVVYLDLAGESLHRRGYRSEHGEAPLKETLAAAMLRLSGWNRASPLVDPMCGAGTLPIEAAMWSRSVAPGLLRQRFGFERWACHDGAAASRMAELRRLAFLGRKTEGPDITGSDQDPAILDVARENGRKAGVRVRWSRAVIADLQPSGPAGWVVFNPPYGARIPMETGLGPEVAAAMRRMKGWSFAILSGAPEFESSLRRRPDRWFLLHNGDIACRLLVYRP